MRKENLVGFLLVQALLKKLIILINGLKSFILVPIAYNIHFLLKRHLIKS